MTDMYKIAFRTLVFRAIKYHKRMVIVLERSPKMIPIGTDSQYLAPKGPTIFYTPPDFLRPYVQNREMHELADRLQLSAPEDRIDQIIDFEEKIWAKHVAQKQEKPGDGSKSTTDPKDRT